MTGSAPRIVVSLPARDIGSAVAEVRTARAAGADAAELRADRLVPGEIERVDRLFPSPLALVATYRSRAEGGEGEDDPDRRRAVLSGLARHPFRWIDLELARDRGVDAELPPREQLGRIYSAHLGPSPPARWTGTLRELESVDGVGKLVVEAGVRTALQELLPEARRAGEDVVILTTGPSGPLLRAWSRRLGFPLVYASLPAGGGTVEASQVPVDLLRPYLEAEVPPPLFALLGRPVGHSASPAIHQRWIAADGERGLYLALEIADDREFVDALAPLAEGGFRGVNVTHPYKAVAVEAADELGRGAEACGVANCLTLRDGRVVAENTDLLAILRRLEELRASRAWDGGSLAVIGAGGAARATLAAARSLGIPATVHARRRAEADRLALAFAGEVPGRGRSPKPATLVVHATDVGREPDRPLEVPLGPLLAPGAYVLDWVYRPAQPTIRQATEAAGATYEDGWRLLVYQAAASFDLWWDHPPSEAAIGAVVAGGG